MLLEISSCMSSKSTRMIKHMIDSISTSDCHVFLMKSRLSYDLNEKLERYVRVKFGDIYGKSMLGTEMTLTIPVKNCVVVKTVRSAGISSFGSGTSIYIDGYTGTALEKDIVNHEGRYNSLYITCDDTADETVLDGIVDMNSGKYFTIAPDTSKCDGECRCDYAICSKCCTCHDNLDYSKYLSELYMKGKRAMKATGSDCSYRIAESMLKNDGRIISYVNSNCPYYAEHQLSEWNDL